MIMQQLPKEKMLVIAVISGSDEVANWACIDELAVDQSKPSKQRYRGAVTTFGRDSSLCLQFLRFSFSSPAHDPIITRSTLHQNYCI